MKKPIVSPSRLDILTPTPHTEAVVIETQSHRQSRCPALTSEPNEPTKRPIRSFATVSGFASQKYVKPSSFTEPQVSGKLGSRPMPAVAVMAANAESNECSPVNVRFVVFFRPATAVASTLNVAIARLIESDVRAAIAECSPLFAQGQRLSPAHRPSPIAHRPSPIAHRRCWPIIAASRSSEPTTPGTLLPSVGPNSVGLRLA